MMFGDESKQRPSSGFVFQNNALLHLIVTKFWASLKSRSISEHSYWNLLNFDGEAEKVQEVQEKIGKYLNN